MRFRATAVSSVISSSMLAVSLGISCGGASSDADRGSAGSGGSSQAIAGKTSVQLPDSCSSPTDCPSGYECVPDGNVPLMTVTDTECMSQCTPSCDLAGPLKETCMQTCADACKKQVPADGAEVKGKCMAAESGGSGSSESGGGSSAAGSGGQASEGTAGGGSSQTSFVWSGNWTADVSHTSNCEWSSATQTGKQSYTVTINATGENSSPKAAVSGGFALEGTGGSDHINLTGDFPFRSWKGEVATTNSLNSPNNATIKITNIESANKASGTIEGSWNASGGWTCKTASGTITLTR